MEAKRGLEIGKRRDRVFRHHMSSLRTQGNGTNADDFLSADLRLQMLRLGDEAEIRRLLRFLFLRHSELPADADRI